MPNGPAGHAAVADLARDRDGVVCFEATGGQDWQLWEAPEAEGIIARHGSPVQAKAFAPSRGPCARTDRIDAEPAARFFAFRPDAGRQHPTEKLRLLRALTSKRGQVVGMRKRPLTQIRAHQKLGTAKMFDSLDTDLKARPDCLIRALEDRIAAAKSSDALLVRSRWCSAIIPGIGPVAGTMAIAERPDLGTIEQAAALVGPGPGAHDSGALRAKRTIARARRALRHVMFQAALVAAHRNPSMQAFADRLRKAGKPHKVIITAVARKPVNLAKALGKNRQKRTPSTA